MKFISKVHINGQDIQGEIEYPNFKSAVAVLEQRFRNDPDAVTLEERKYENGSQSVSIKNASNKILIQYKTIP